MEMFIDCGIDCYQSLQTTAGMEVGRLKEMFGDRLCFWGGMPVELLIAGTSDEVRKAVRAAVERGAPGGGSSLGQVIPSQQTQSMTISWPCWMSSLRSGKNIDLGQDVLRR
jgi:hypothetical protein